MSAIWILDSGFQMPGSRRRRRRERLELVVMAVGVLAPGMVRALLELRRRRRVEVLPPGPAAVQRPPFGSVDGGRRGD